MTVDHFAQKSGFLAPEEQDVYSLAFFISFRAP
jgi:hypothetical protein